MNGVPVTPKRSIGASSGPGTVAVPIGDWPSGLYFVAPGAPRTDAIGFAPFVVSPAPARRASRCSRPADPDLAGVQLPRRRRGRLRRLLVRGSGARTASASAELTSIVECPMGSAYHLRIPQVAALVTQAGRLCSRNGTSSRSRAPTSWRGSTTCWCSPDITSTSPRRSTTSWRASAIAAATSCSSPRTTSSDPSREGRTWSVWSLAQSRPA